ITKHGQSVLDIVAMKALDGMTAIWKQGGCLRVAHGAADLRQAAAISFPIRIAVEEAAGPCVAETAVARVPAQRDLVVQGDGDRRGTRVWQEDALHERPHCLGGRGCEWIALRHLLFLRAL